MLALAPAARAPDRAAACIGRFVQTGKLLRASACRELSRRSLLLAQRRGCRLSVSAMRCDAERCVEDGLLQLRARRLRALAPRRQASRRRAVCACTRRFQSCAAAHRSAHRQLLEPMRGRLRAEPTSRSTARPISSSSASIWARRCDDALGLLRQPHLVELADRAAAAAALRPPRAASAARRVRAPARPAPPPPSSAPRPDICFELLAACLQLLDLALTRQDAVDLRVGGVEAHAVAREHVALRADQHRTGRQARRAAAKPCRSVVRRRRRCSSQSVSTAATPGSVQVM